MMIFAKPLHVTDELIFHHKPVSNLKYSYNQIMLEYLIVNNRLESAKSFQEKCSKTISEELLSLFTKGSRSKFIQLFTLLRKQAKLEFYLRVYFLIYHIHPSLKAKTSIPEEQILSFKEYIDSRGAELAKTNEFLQFYALPYIKKPLEHLAFKNLFKKEWVVNLKQKLKIYLLEEDKRLKYEASKLFEGVSKADEGANSDKVREMEEINRRLFEEVREFKEKYQYLEESHKTMIDGFHSHMMESQSKWFQIVKELVSCSKSLICMLSQSESPYTNDRKFIKICKRTEKYQRFVNKKFDDLISQSQDISIFDKPSINELSSYSISQKNLTGFINFDDYIPTDFDSMKKTFWKKDNLEKVMILNGLFWRIAKCKDTKSRRMNIMGILNNDFLCLQSANIDELLASRQLMKPTLRLINAMTMDKYGRSLIFTNTTMYRDILALVGNCSDESCLQYIIIIIEHLSAEGYFKRDLLNNDIIGIYVTLLRDEKIQRNEVIVENIGATLLNLTEREQGIRQFRKQTDIFNILKRYLETDFMITKVITYAIIYSLLEDEYMFNLAHKEKLLQFILYMRNKNPSQNRKQIDPILAKLKKFEPKSGSRKVEEVEINEEDEDLYECEIEEESLEEYMKDHEEITRRFSLKGKEAKKQLSEIRQAYEEYNQNKLPKFFQPDSHIKNKNKEKKKGMREGFTPEYQKMAYQSPQKEESIVKQKFNNYLTNENQRKNPNFRIKENEERSFRDHQDGENKKIRKSTSVDKFDRQKDQKLQYQGSSKHRLKELKPIDERSYRSPQGNKKSREEVLKQLNDQLKASEHLKQSNQKKGSGESKINKGKVQEIEAFQSKPKLRRTPPHDDD